MMRLRDSHGKYLGSASGRCFGTQRRHAFAANARRGGTLVHRETDCGAVSDDRHARAVAQDPVAMQIGYARSTHSTLIAPARARASNVLTSLPLLTKRVAEIDHDFAIVLRDQIQSNLCVPPQDSVEISTGIASPWGLPRNLQRNDMTMSASKVASRSGSVTGEHAVV
jgi:hypothetical protein